MASYFDRVLNGTKKDVIDELEQVIRWARGLSPAQWANIENSSGGLRGFIREVMELDVEEIGNSPHP